MKNEPIQHKDCGQPTKRDRETDGYFLKHEVFGNLSLSLDVVRRRLMISELVNRIGRSFQIHLPATKKISIKKVYKDIYAWQLKRKRLEDFLEAIYLQFEFLDGKQAIHVPVFDRAVDNLHDLPETEKKLLYWQDLLSEVRSIKG